VGAVVAVVQVCVEEDSMALAHYFLAFGILGGEAIPDLAPATLEHYSFHLAGLAMVLTDLALHFIIDCLEEGVSFLAEIAVSA